MKKVVELIEQEISNLDCRINASYNESDELRNNNWLLSTHGVDVDSREDALYELRKGLQDEVDELEENLVSIKELL